MARRLPPLSSLRAFEAAARNLSFTRAAEEIYVTQAAVSHQIKALEDFLGVKLFTRKNRELLLTDEGQMYWPHIRDMFEKLADATERVKAQKAAGPLSVSVVPTFAVQWLVPRLSRFSEQHPEIDVRLKAWDSEVNFQNDNVDIAIYFGDGNWPGFHVERLLEEFLFPVCSPTLLQGSKPLSHPSDLAQHTLLHDDNHDSWRRWLHFVGAKSVKWNRGPVFSHTGMVLQAAAHGQGVALGHSVLAQNDLATGRLVRPFEQMLPLEESYFLVCPMTAADRPKISAFRQWLLQTIDEERLVR